MAARGTVVDAVIRGRELFTVQTVLTDLSCTGKTKISGTEWRIHLEISSFATKGPHEIRVRTAPGTSNPVTFTVTGSGE